MNGFSLARYVTPALRLVHFRRQESNACHVLQDQSLHQTAPCAFLVLRGGRARRVLLVCRAMLAMSLALTRRAVKLVILGDLAQMEQFVSIVLQEQSLSIRSGLALACIAQLAK